MIEDYGYVGGPVAGKGAVPARVLGTWGDYYRVVCDAGEGIARKKASAFHGRPDAVIPTTGDFVSLKWNPHGESRILATLPRHSTFARTDPSSSGHKAQVIAVNFDNAPCSIDINIPIHAFECLGIKQGEVTAVDLLSDRSTTAMLETGTTFHTDIEAHGAVIWKLTPLPRNARTPRQAK